MRAIRKVSLSLFWSSFLIFTSFLMKNPYPNAKPVANHSFSNNVPAAPHTHRASSETGKMFGTTIALHPDVQVVTNLVLNI